MKILRDPTHALQAFSGQIGAKLRALSILSALPVALGIGCTSASEDGDADGVQAQVGAHGVLDSTYPEFRLSPSDLVPFFSPNGRTVLLETEAWYWGRIRVLGLDASGNPAPKWSTNGGPKVIVVPSPAGPYGGAPGWVTTVITEDLDDDGVITIAGFFSDDRGFIARLRDGEVDTSFHGGAVFFDVRVGSRAHADAVIDGQGGTYVLVSDDTRGRAKLVYLDRDGNVDPKFGEGGALAVGRSGEFKYANITWDGVGVLVADRTETDILSPCQFIRYTRTGAVDQSFGDRGEAIFEPGDNAGTTACVLYPAVKGGKFFLNDALSRLDSKGQLTNVFSGPWQTDGLVFPLVPFGETAKGNVLYRSSWSALVNMRADGSIDTDWGKNGLYDARPDQNRKRDLRRARLTPTGAVMVGLTEPNTTIVRRLTP